MNEISIKIFPLSLITFIRQNCPSFNTNNLFYTFTFRIVICFIETTAKVGNYHKNPFDFRRKWTVTTSETQNIERNFSERELFLEQRLADIEAKFKNFQEQFKPKPKGKGNIL